VFVIYGRIRDRRKVIRYYVGATYRRKYDAYVTKRPLGFIRLIGYWEGEECRVRPIFTLPFLFEICRYYERKMSIRG